MAVLLKLMREDVFSAEAWQQEMAAGLLESLNGIITTYEVHGTGSETESRIASVANQNMDAEAAPVSSLQWAKIALELSPFSFSVGSATKEDVNQVLEGLRSVLDKYNDRTEVQASVDTAMTTQGTKRRRTSRGANNEEEEDLGLLVGKKKAAVIENFLLKSNMGFWDEVHKHLDTIPLKYSAWSEKLWQVPALWKDSEIQFDPNSISDVPPPTNEPSVLVNWALPLSGAAHVALARRVSKDYLRATAVISSMDKKRQQRKTQAFAWALQRHMALHKRCNRNTHCKSREP